VLVLVPVPVLVLVLVLAPGVGCWRSCCALAIGTSRVVG